MSRLVDYLPDRDHFFVYTDYKSKDEFTFIPRKRWTNAVAGKGWKVPATYGNMIALADVADNSWTDAAKNRAIKIAEIAQNQYQSKTSVDLDRDKYFRFSDLSPVQQNGMSWLTKGSGILGDEQGSGKTVQAMAAIDYMDAKRVIVVCPKSVMRSWEVHTKEWTTSHVPVIIDGPAAKRRKIIAEGLKLDRVVFIIGWQMLRTHTMLAGFGGVKRSAIETVPKELNGLTFDVLIADEAHRGKNPRAKQTRALWALDAEKRWALSGTPLANSPTDFWSLLRFINENDWPSRMRFIDEYCRVEDDFFGGETVVGFNERNMKLFRSRTSYQFLHREMSEVIGRDIVKKRSRRYAQLKGEHLRAYRDMKQTLVAELESGNIRARGHLASIIRCIQLTGSMLDINDSGKVVQVHPSPKAKVLVNTIKDIGLDKPIIVMSSLKGLLYLCRDEIDKVSKSYAIVTGDTPQQARDTYLEEFQAGRINILMSTIGVFSEGVDLSKAKHLIMVQRPWSMVDSNQAEDRIRRWTQKSDVVEIIDIITENTIDARIIEVLNRKKGNLYDLTSREVTDLL